MGITSDEFNKKKDDEEIANKGYEDALNYKSYDSPGPSTLDTWFASNKTLNEKWDKEESYNAGWDRGIKDREMKS